MEVVMKEGNKEGVMVNTTFLFYDWMRSKHISENILQVYFIMLALFSCILLSEFHMVLFSSYNEVSIVLFSIFFLVIIPVASTFLLIAPFYFVARHNFYKDCKARELKIIFKRLQYFHPEQSFESRMEIAMQGSTLWKLAGLMAMWRQLNKNSCTRKYNHPYI